jgi:hypothetical protein
MLSSSCQQLPLPTNQAVLYRRLQHPGRSGALIANETRVGLCSASVPEQQ